MPSYVFVMLEAVEEQFYSDIIEQFDSKLIRILISSFCRFFLI